MAVAIVTSISGITSATNGIAATRVDVSAVVSTNCNCLVAFVHYDSVTCKDVIWDVSGGAPQTMTTVGEGHNGASVFSGVKAFSLMNPTGGVHILRAHMTATAAGLVIGSYSLSGVADSGSIENFVATTFSGANPQLSANVPSTANNVVLDAAMAFSTTDVSANVVLSAGADQTSKYQRRPQGAATRLGWSSNQTGETSTRMSWGTNIGAGAPIGATHVALDIVSTAAAGGGGGGAKRSNLPILGVG